MAAIKPTLLLVHGCFGTSKIYSKLVPLLEKTGYAIVNVDLLSANPDNPEEVTAQKDIDLLRETYLLPLIEAEHKNVVIIAHSYGGAVSAPAAVGLSKTDRVASGARGGVIGLVWVAGNCVQENKSLFETAGSQWPPWLILDTPRPVLAEMNLPLEYMFHDVDQSQVEEALSTVTPCGYRCIETKVSRPCWTEKGYEGRLAYVRTTEDRVLPPFVQNMAMEVSGVRWDVVDIHSSHAPMFSKPEELAQHIDTFATRFGQISA